MNKLDQHFSAMWQAYTKVNPDAKTIHELFAKDNTKVVNDHIALRTYGLEPINIATLSASFIKLGYVAKDNYEFKNKHLLATHFAHQDPGLPKVFISALKVDALSDSAQDIIQSLVAQVPTSSLKQDDFCYSGRPWNISYADYKKLLLESEYAAWLAAFGFVPNHFTISVNHLDNISEFAQVNKLLKDNGFELNGSGGEIKGSKQDLLEQSSTLAKPISVEFTDGKHTIPGCYYEFAKRYSDKDGNLFQGFVAKSADKIFESTDVIAS